MVSQGFSLLELVVALTVAALLFAIVAPTGLGRRERAELASNAGAVAAALRATRSEAILADKPADFVVDVDKALYRVGGRAPARQLVGAPKITLYTTTDETLSKAVGAIRFYPDGSSTGGGIALSRDGRRYDVLVDWLTGEVSVHEQAEPAR